MLFDYILIESQAQKHKVLKLNLCCLLVDLVLQYKYFWVNLCWLIWYYSNYLDSNPRLVQLTHSFIYLYLHRKNLYRFQLICPEN